MENLFGGVKLNELDWLPKNAPYVEVEPKHVQIIGTPTEFYEKLIVLIRGAKERIVISTLYMGNSNYENQLADELVKALDINPDMKMSILLDCLRGTRGGVKNSSISLLKRLVPRASVYLFHTPFLRGLKKMMLPERVNEVVGLQHIKLLVFDNDVIITGANLSKTYFTDRQDRYILIENCPKLANFVHLFVEAIGSSSFKLNVQGTITLAEKCFVHPFKGSLTAYRKMLRERVMTAISVLEKTNSEVDYSMGTRIYPLIQMSVASINQEFEFLKSVLSRQNDLLSLTLSSGYFNFTDSYINFITMHRCYDMDIVYASPQANGFYQASGLSGFIPLIYVFISRLFYNIMLPKVRLFEYNRPGWSYHVKGMWVDIKRSVFSATLIGSSNFGHRSVHRDLETQFLIVTDDERLKRNLKEERLRMLNYAAKVDSSTFLRRDHLVPFWIRWISRFVMVLLQGLICGRVLMNSLAQKGAAPVVATSHRVRTFRRKGNHHRNDDGAVNPYEASELLQRLGGCSVRHFSSKTSASASQSLEELLKDEVWIPVYRFRGIHYGALATKTKLALTVSSIALVPYKWWQYSQDNISSDQLLYVLSFASFTTLALFFLSRFFGRMIGVISMNATNDYIRVGYLSFWGNRRNKYMKLEDVVPLNEASTSISDKVTRFQQYGSYVYSFKFNFLYISLITTNFRISTVVHRNFMCEVFCYCKVYHNACSENVEKIYNCRSIS
ncbi:unnamed protein product [Thelazia callipaeda]|uniref:CDP-diacylglycerol--glycerol-3-phosphate 3-phosphatidyltransferase n=1 Tax=Thelazia callipaeda TaxID=103827 RepID=A0A0N5DAG6_THECL|nr:unnamed protein product [Thelazia callipaeda]